jgi:DNA (cytosine-5)-methyltransferase 1
MIVRSHKPKRIHLIPKEELNDFVRQRSVYSEEGKSPCLLARSDSPKIMKKETHDKPQHIGTAVDIKGHDVLKRVYSPDGKSPTVTTCGGGHREPKVVVQSYREVRTEEAKRLRRESKKNTGKDHTPFRAKKIVPREDGKVGTVTPGLNNDHMISLTRDKDQEVYWRKLTPLECERLQTVPDNYTNHVSNTQRYKMLGNGWTIEVIAHIFKNMEVTS